MTTATLLPNYVSDHAPAGTRSAYYELIAICNLMRRVDSVRNHDFIKLTPTQLRRLKRTIELYDLRRLVIGLDYPEASKAYSSYRISQGLPIHVNYKY